MTEERDPKISRRYRELGAEEPSHELDAAILAASRRTAKLRPAPLVPPTGRRRWYFPVAAAAVIMLSVAVTWHMQLERPDPGAELAQAPASAPAAPLPEKASEPKAPAAELRADAQARDEVSNGARARREQAPAAGRMMAQEAQAETPEKWLERIAELRKAGKHEEADKELAAFRKRYPEHKVPAAALKQQP